MKADELYVDNLRDTHWLGEVVENKDPLKEGRCRVKVFGKFDKIPTEAIPWATQGNENITGSYNVPKIGDIVSIRFDNGDIYHPEYFFTINSLDRRSYKDEVLSELDDELATKSHSILYDSENNVRVYYHPEDGLMINLGVENTRKKEPYIQIKNNGEINIFTESNNITVNTDQQVEIKCDKAYVNSSNIELGETAMEQVIKGNTFQALFNAHTHVGNMGAPTTPPVVPLTGTELSQVTKTQ
tara:strand:+ start:4975 stop:5700 length:726 start_codon:yes stop_codon:yes gene_type:complete